MAVTGIIVMIAAASAAAMLLFGIMDSRIDMAFLLTWAPYLHGDGAWRMRGLHMNVTVHVFRRAC